MQARDPHRYVNELDGDAIARLVARLEGRAKDRVFARLFDQYAGELAAPSGGRVLEVGCGTGAMSRFLVGRDDFRGTAVGVDHSPAFVEAGTRFAADEGLADRVRFRVGDAHRLDFPDASFDAVFAHTLVSHVADPRAVLSEMARVTRPGGTLLVCEFSTPTWAPFRTIYLEYLMRALPEIADRTSSNPDAYVYLAESIRAWPDQNGLAQLIARSGWTDVRYRNLTGGIVALHRARAV